MVKQPKIAGDVWFNSELLSPADLKGRVVLVDFWTYSCVNCQRTIPYLRAWWKKYKDKGLIIIGIHTPEFEFEKDAKNVADAIRDSGVTWPVVLDNDYINWNNFENHYWPATYLIDQDGNTAYSHFGEGAYEETEREIQKLLSQNTPDGVRMGFEEDKHSHGTVCFIPTPETYCGYMRGRLANIGGYRKEKVFEYRSPSELELDSIALQGKFFAMPEYVESSEIGAILLLRFRATEVNLVIDPSENPGDFLQILFNGTPLSEEMRGYDADDLGVIKVTKPRMYNILKCKQLAEGMLQVKIIGGKMRLHAFTFSGCEG